MDGDFISTFGSKSGAAPALVAAAEGFGPGRGGGGGVGGNGASSLASEV